MSRENVEKFYVLTEKDQVLKAELLEMDERYKKKDITRAMLPALIEKEVIPIAKKRGLIFSTEEFMEYLEEKRDKLAEEDLLNVSGGLSPKQAAIGISGVLLLSIGAGIGAQFIAKAVDSQPGQKIEQQINNERKPEKHKLYTKGKSPERQKDENKGEDKDGFKNQKNSANIKRV